MTHTAGPSVRKDPQVISWMSIVGARPQFVKLAPLCRAMEKINSTGGFPRIKHTIVHTGQHYDPQIADVFFERMHIPLPDHNLSVGSGSHGSQLARMLERLEPVMLAERPNWVIVYGDTNSTLAGALLAARLHLPLAHVEAGCRSADMRMPEEQTRIVVDHLSQLLLAPSQSAVDNLLREGIANADDPRHRRIRMVGDVMYDAVLNNVDVIADYKNGNREPYFHAGEYYLLTLHRAENTDGPDRLMQILTAVESLDLPVLFPVHPRTKKVISDNAIQVGANIRTVAPLCYMEMLLAQRNARKILTDSGGVQKEAFYLGTQCVTLRDRTEWPETVEAGANILAGTEPDRIREAVYRRQDIIPHKAFPYGNGRASENIINELLATDTVSV